MGVGRQKIQALVLIATEETLEDFTLFCPVQEIEAKPQHWRKQILWLYGSAIVCIRPNLQPMAGFDSALVVSHGTTVVGAAELLFLVPP